MRSPIAEALRAITAGFMVASTVATGACYRYSPIASQSPPLGTEVRVVLTDAGAVTLAPLVGNRIEMVDGRISAVGDTSVTLAVTQTTDRLGSEVPWKGETVAFPRATVASLEKKSLDRGRSYLFGAIAAGAIILAGAAFAITGSGSGGSSSGPPTPK